MPSPLLPWADYTSHISDNHQVMSSAPLGAFDSGVGGLSVLREIRRLLPAEDLIYVADSGHAPYGDKTREVVLARAEAICTYLADQGAKAIVVACNTATAVAVDELRVRFPMPIVAIEPAVKPAAARTRSGVVGVLATTTTLASERFSGVVSHHANGVRVLSQPCPGLVEQVEAGDLSGGETPALIARYVEPLLARGADTLVLGCTHYSFVAPLIQEVAGPAVEIIDPASAVASEVKRRLGVGGLQAEPSRVGHARLITTGDLATTRTVVSQLWPTVFDTIEHRVI